MPLTGAPRVTANQNPGQRVHNDGDNKQRQPDFDKGAQVKLVRGFAELIGDDTGHAVGRGQQRARNFRPVANHHGDRHGFAQSAAQTKNYCADNTDARVAQHAHADHLPARGSQGQHCFPLRMGDRRHNFASERRDDRQNHDGENHAGSKHPDSIIRPGEDSGPTQGFDQERIQVLAEQRNQHKNRPQTIHDAGDGGQQLGKKGQESAQPGGAHFGEEDGDAYGQGHGNNERQDRRHHGAVDERQRTEIAIDRIPGRSKEK